MHMFEVGKPYPLHNRANGQERAVSQRTAAFFDVLYYSPTAAADAATWRTGALKIGLAEPTAGVPFVLLELPGSWQFDVTLNLHKADTPEAARAWLASPANTITLYLLDARSNIIRGMRLISVPAAWADELRAVASRQLGRYPDAAAVDAAIRAKEAVSLGLMIRTTRMLSVHG